MANIFFSTTGNDANPGSQISPKLTPNAAIAIANPGDTVFGRGGTYANTINIAGLTGGSSGAPYRIQGFNGEIPIITGNDGGSRGLNGLQSGVNWIILQDLKFDGGGTHDNTVSAFGDPSGGSHDVQLVNIEITGWKYNGLLLGGAVTNYTLRGCKIHGQISVDANRWYGLYISSTTNLIVEDCEIYGNPGGGLQVYPGSNNNVILRRNIIHNNCSMPTSAIGGMLLAGPVKCYQNIIYNNGESNQPGILCSAFGETGSLSELFNNTIYGNLGFAIVIEIRANGVKVKNNILFGNGTDGIADDGIGTVKENNFIGDPSFVDAPGGDFHLQSGSPAIDFGAVVDGVAYTGSSPDAGALEFGAEDLPAVSVTVTPNPIPPDESGTVTWESDGDNVDVSGVGQALPPSGNAQLPTGQTVVSVQANNNNGSSFVQQSVGQFSSGLVCRASLGHTPRSIKAGSDMSVDNLEIITLMPSRVMAQAHGLIIRGLDNQDIELGALDHARAEIFQVNHQDPSMGKFYLPGSGNIGQVRIKRITNEAELRGKMIYMAQTFGGLCSRLCDAIVGDDITDYRRQGFGCKVRLQPVPWRPSTAVTVRPDSDAGLGSVVRPSVFINRHFECSVAGVTGTIEPTWPLRIGDTVVDGTATWTAIQALTVFGTVSAALDTRFFSDNSRNEPPTMGIGVNAGTAQYAIRSVDKANKRFFIEGGDLTGVFRPTNTFQVTGSPNNNGTYTVVTAVVVGSRTRITVAESIPSNKDGGFVTAATEHTTGFFEFGKLTFLSGYNKGITGEVKTFSLTPYPIIVADTGGNVFEINGDRTAFFAVDQRIAVKDSTGNDDVYDVVSVTYNAGTDRTEIEVAQTIEDATADGSVLSGPGQFEMFEQFPYPINADDKYMVKAGCDQSEGLCINRFRNIHNRRAEAEVPGTDVATRSTSKPL